MSESKVAFTAKELYALILDACVEQRISPVFRDDVVNRVWLAVLDARRQPAVFETVFDPPVSYEYVATAVRHAKSKDDLRNRDHLLTHYDLDEFQSLPDSSTSDLITMETVELVQSILSALSFDDRMLLAAYYMEGRESRSLAMELHVTPAALRQRIHRLVLHVRSELAKRGLRASDVFED